MKKLLLVVLTLALLIAVGLWLGVRRVQGPRPEEGATDLRFVEVDLRRFWKHIGFGRCRSGFGHCDRLYGDAERLGHR